MEGYLRIPNHIRYSAELKAADKVLLAEILSCADDQGWSKVSNTYLGGVLGVTDRRVKQIVADLVHGGWLEIKREANRRQLRVAPVLLEGEENFTVQEISPCKKFHGEIIDQNGVKKISPIKDNIKIIPSQSARACEGDGESIQELAAKVAGDYYDSYGQLALSRAKSKDTGRDLWDAVVLDTAQWLYMSRQQQQPGYMVTERDLRGALANLKLIRRAISNIKANGEPGTTTKPADINSEAARQERQREWTAQFAQLAAVDTEPRGGAGHNAI